LNHLIVNISWQSNYWTGKPTQDEQERSGFGEVNKGNANEMHNFDFQKNVVDGTKAGFANKAGRARTFTKGGIVFFHSLDRKQNKTYIVGLYGGAEVGDFKSGPYNIRAPIELCVRWKEIHRLPVDKKRYFVGQKKMGQINFMNIGDKQAKEILDDAISVHADSPQVQQQLSAVQKVVWGPQPTDQAKTPMPIYPVALRDLMEMTENTRNVILHGPPGTGKTWLSNHFSIYFLLWHNVSHEDATAYWVAVNDGNRSQSKALRALVESESDPNKAYRQFTTFHQSFAYEEFVEGLKPLKPEDGGQNVTYDVVPGTFRETCERAKAAWQEHKNKAPKYMLVIDEINRANTAKVLGELITLIEDDKRLGEENEITLKLPYSKDIFGVPPNLYILGTMNTADRSLALLDLALRRRFQFHELAPDPSLLRTVDGVDLRRLLTELNTRIAALLDPEHGIGHSYLLNVKDAHELRLVWYGRVVPLLCEYFHAEGQRLKAVLGTDFIEKKTVQPGTANALGELFDPDSWAYPSVKKLDGTDFLHALRRLAGQDNPPLGADGGAGS